jgi:hypothetical protein
MSGVAVAAGMAFSAPAMAATSTPSPAGHTTQVAPHGGHTWSEGTYRSLSRCRAEGRSGVWSGDWDYYRCVPTRRGFTLIVTEEWNHWGNGNNWNQGNNWGNGGNWNHPHPGGMNHPHPMPHPKPEPKPKPTI